MGSVRQQIIINASIEKVWQTIRNFHDVSWAPKVATSVVRQGDIPGTVVGAKRIINDVFYETLSHFNEAQHTFSYQIDKGPGPLKADLIENYIGTVTLSADGENTLVDWSASFSAEDEQAVANFCNPMYRALLTAMKDSLS